MRKHDPTVIRQAAKLLSPTSMSRFLADLARCSRSTARSWLSGHRQPPIYVLERLKEELAKRAREMLSLSGSGGGIDHAIWLHRQEQAVKCPLRARLCKLK